MEGRTDRGAASRASHSQSQQQAEDLGNREYGKGRCKGGLYTLGAKLSQIQFSVWRSFGAGFVSLSP